LDASVFLITATLKREGFDFKIQIENFGREERAGRQRYEKRKEPAGTPAVL
jgi:hypothetical protein